MKNETSEMSKKLSRKYVVRKVIEYVLHNGIISAPDQRINIRLFVLKSEMNKRDI